MKNAIIERSKVSGLLATIILALTVLFGFGVGVSHAEAQELSPPVVLLREVQMNTVSAEPTVLTIDAILEKALVTEPPPVVKVSAKPKLNAKQRVQFIVPTPSVNWKAAYGKYVIEAARRNKLPPDLVMAVIAVESGFNHRARNGSSYGLMQIKLATAKGFGLERGGVAALMNPATNINVATNYLGAAWKLSNGNICATVSRYNRGLGSRKLNAAYCAKVRRIMRYGDFQLT